MLNDEYVDVRLEFTMKRLSTNVKRLRKVRGWSQTDLAEKIDSSQSVIHDIEANHSYNPTVFTVVKVAAAFGLTVSQILNPHLKV
jgi:DNA-binding XRE family transcriptional regulator